MALSTELTVAELTPLSPTARAIRFKASEKLSFFPGQFFMLEFNLANKQGFSIPEGKEAVQKRAFSVSSSPLSDYLEVTVKKTQTPFVSSYLVDFLKVGEKVIATGPYGRFYFNEKETKNNVLLLSAGSGIAPLISIMRYIYQKNLPINCCLLYSNKSEEEILWRKEIEELCLNRPNLTHCFTITQDHNNINWRGCRGRINKQMIQSCLASPKETDCYICGPLEFVMAMESILKELSITTIKKEVYE